MYDFWFALGACIIDNTNTTFSNVSGAGPAFTQVNARVITEVAMDHSTKVFANARTCGVLATATCNQFRANLRGAIAPAFPAVPPMSIYTAGRLSQLLLVKSMQFATVMGLAQTAYHTAANGRQPASPCFPGAVGVILIDQVLAGVVANTPGQPPATTFFAEFSMANLPTDQAILSAYSALIIANGAQSRLLAGKDAQGNTVSDTPWQDVCPDQYLFWDPQNQRAII